MNFTASQSAALSPLRARSALLTWQTVMSRTWAISQSALSCAEFRRLSLKIIFVYISHECFQLSIGVKSENSDEFLHAKVFIVF